MEAIQVAIRIRPFLNNENSSSSSLTLNKEDDRKICVSKGIHYFEAYYDQIFFNSSTQEDLYAFIAPGINKAKQSFFNCTIIAYGQTGSGKTYTMFGSDWTNNQLSSPYSEYLHTDIIIPKVKRDKYDFIQNMLYIDPFSRSNGIIPRILQNLFHKPKYKIVCSYIQIYNERIYDLLGQNNSKENKKEKFITSFGYNNTSINPISQKPLTIQEDKTLGIIINNMMELETKTLYDCYSLLQEGEKHRKTRQTNKNELSSRSHTIFIIALYKENDNGDISHKAKIHLCDLAGSEKYDNKETYKELHKAELVKINLSLVALGNVIHSLVNNSSHVPYRDSKITKILQDSLGGKAKTYIIATVSPTIDSADETISTLKFADRAHSVFCRVEPNEISLGSEGSNKLIKKLTTELSELKDVLNRRNKNLNYDPYKEELTRLRHENNELKKYVMNNDPLKRLITENKLLKSEIKKISKSVPWTQLTTSYHEKDKEREREPRSLLNQENKGNVRYLPFNNAGNEIIYGNDNNISNNYSNNNSYNSNININNKLFQKEKKAPAEIEGLKGNIEKSRNNLKRLDEMEKENQIQTQKLIDDILKKTRRKDN